MFHKIINALIFIYETFFKKAVGPQDAAEVIQGKPGEKVEADTLNGPVLDEISLEIEATEIESFNTKRLHIIDAGHVETTLGKSSPPFENGTVLKEYEINHDIASRVGIILTVEYGFKEGRDYIHTIGPNKVFNSTFQEIKARFDIVDAYKNGKEMLFYSIHHNAINHGGKWQSPSGTETWHQRGNVKSKRVAALFQKNLIEALGFRNRGLKVARPEDREFMVFRECNKRGIVGVLLEIGFFSNLEEAKILKSSLYRDKAAKVIAKTIAELEGIKLK
jgi:N-acetylmuramoyl-L-alanine amidase